MKLFIRLFARYVAHVGYLDGKRNFPGENDFVEIPLHAHSASTKRTASSCAKVLQIPEVGELKDRRP